MLISKADMVALRALPDEVQVRIRTLAVPDARCIAARKAIRREVLRHHLLPSRIFWPNSFHLLTYSSNGVAGHRDQHSDLIDIVLSFI